MRWPILSRRKLIAASVGAVPFAVAAHSLWWEPTWLVTRRLRLCQSTPTHRLVHFTDIHHKGDRKYLERVVSMINALKPDFVCFTGDIVEDAEFLPESLEVLREIRAPVFGIPGNHDYWARIDFGPVAACFAATGGRWLMDQNVQACDKTVNVIGLTCNHALKLRPISGLKNLLLFHYPAWVDKTAGLKFDLMLAGHSHGGQVRFPLYGPLLVPFGVGEFDMGLYQTASGPLYVNPGIGYFYLNVRFCCRPEVTLIEI